MMSVWKTLSSINVNEHTERKGNLTYLSWAWAWAVTKQHYPDACYTFHDNEVHSDGTMTVHCDVIIDELAHEMWLPVMDHRNNAVANPNAFQINTAKMRCLTKGLSMHGLGAYIYAGEDLPAPEPEKSYEDWCAENKDSILAVKAGIANEDLASAAEAWFELDNETKQALWKAPSKGGCFTTQEREILKSPEFRQAHFGEDSE
jgi:hypothetical protein